MAGAAGEGGKREQGGRVLLWMVLCIVQTTGCKRRHPSGAGAFYLVGIEVPKMVVSAMKGWYFDRGGLKADDGPWTKMVIGDDDVGGYGLVPVRTCACIHT